MSTFALLRGDVLDYAQKNIRVDLGHLTLSPNGRDLWYPNDIGCFSCTISNMGPMLVTNFRIHIYTNGFVEVRRFPHASNLNWTNELQFGPFSIEPNEEKRLKELQFKAVRKMVGFKDAVFAYVDEFDLSWWYHAEKKINVF